MLTHGIAPEYLQQVIGGDLAAADAIIREGRAEAPLGAEATTRLELYVNILLRLEWRLCGDGLAIRRALCTPLDALDGRAPADLIGEAQPNSAQYAAPSMRLCGQPNAGFASGTKFRSAGGLHRREEIKMFSILRRTPAVFRIAGLLLLASAIIGQVWQRQTAGSGTRATLAWVSATCPSAAFHGGTPRVADGAHAIDRAVMRRFADRYVGGTVARCSIAGRKAQAKQPALHHDLGRGRERVSERPRRRAGIRK